ncbi:Palmitoyltransferase [Pseudozyma hubeiensis]|nr:Palmitoyltransferase [Pseudozyma hubeiensis]
MSLRQRPAGATGSRNMADQTASSPSDHPIPGHDGTPHRPSPRKRIRLNRVLGRIVPIILLVYTAFTYDLVVHRYAFRYLFLHQKRILGPVVWLLPTHGLFLLALRSYLYVFFAYDAELHGQRISWLRRRFGAAINRVSLCHPNGQPILCNRDACRDRPKFFRTRHCGDCGTCRLGFDHHCAWFDNDVTSPATLRHFVGFLLFIPPLCLLGLAPLFPTAWRVVRSIHALSSTNAELRERWWTKWYSWIGGPAYRYLVGWGWAASKWAKMKEARLPHEAVRAPVLVALGGVFVSIAVGLAANSIGNLCQGKLTIDVERQKAFQKLRRRLQKLQAEGKDDGNEAKLGLIRQKIDSLAPVQHFKVSWKEQGKTERRETIVRLPVDQGLLSHGSTWNNLRHFLWDNSDTNHPWSLSDSALLSVLRQTPLLGDAQSCTHPHGR